MTHCVTKVTRATTPENAANSGPDAAQTSAAVVVFVQPLLMQRFSALRPAHV